MSININVNSFEYYIEYLSRWLYYNYINTETSITILKIVVFVILLSLIVYEKYSYFIAGIVVTAAVILYGIISDMSDTSAHGSASGLFSKMNNNDNNNGYGVYRISLDDLTTGVSLSSREGFIMPKVVHGDPSGLDYHAPNGFVEENSREFADNQFKSKKCGLSGGIGAISMFGSNEVIGSREVVYNQLYDFSGNKTNNSTDDRVGAINQQRYKYFKDCVYDPVSKSQNGGFDFRDLKIGLFNGINNKIMDINGENGVLRRFKIDDLMGQTSDAKKVWSVNDIISGSTSTEKFNNIKAIDDKSDAQYSELLRSVNNGEYGIIQSDNNTRKFPKEYKNQILDVFAKAYEFKRTLNNFFAGIRQQQKERHVELSVITISDTVLQDLRRAVNYLRVVVVTVNIVNVDIDKGIGIYDKISKAVTEGEGGFGVLKPLPSLSSLTAPNVASQLTNPAKIFDIHNDDDTYNTRNENRYLYGITYYYTA
jgi:hypothetical protein